MIPNKTDSNKKNKDQLKYKKKKRRKLKKNIILWII
jgi:hypothetical protein